LGDEANGTQATVGDVLQSFRDVMEAVATDTHDQLAEATTASEEAGTRRAAVYGIGAIEVELAAGVLPGPEGTLLLDFQPARSPASRIRFTVEPVPINVSDDGNP
jgi:hypothetical protein